MAGKADKAVVDMQPAVLRGRTRSYNGRLQHVLTELDLEQMYYLRLSGSTKLDVAEFFNMTVDWLYKLSCKDDRVHRILEHGAKCFRGEIAQGLHELVRQRNPQVLIHLSKSVLGNTEKVLVDEAAPHTDADILEAARSVIRDHEAGNARKPSAHKMIVAALQAEKEVEE